MSEALSGDVETADGERVKVDSGRGFSVVDRRRVVMPPPDPARDARVAARRADYARRAGRALDALLADRCDGLRCTCCGQMDYLRQALDY